MGLLRRDEDDRVASVAPYVQAEWQTSRWLVSAGARRSRMTVTVKDRFLGNGNDSGGLAYRDTTPVLGLLYKAVPGLNLYASAARGVETPTLNELFYSGGGAGFNFRLRPAHSTHLEAGTKARVQDSVRVNAAVFEVRTNDELVVDSSSGGRTSYRNGGRTLRQGAELSLDAAWDSGMSTRVALTGLRAVYVQAFGAVREGSRLPGIPNANAFGELAWKDRASHVGLALEGIATGKAYADDANADHPAPGYGLLNARVNTSWTWRGWEVKQFVRLNNLLDKHYVGSLIVGDTNRRYYEAAPGRNWVLGVSARYQL
jgi:iron complex outermembrane receptor protein